MATKILFKLNQAHREITEEDLSDRDTDNLESDIKRKLEQGWTEDEIILFLKCSEEVNPELDEDLALQRMKQISDDVKARLNLREK